MKKIVSLLLCICLILGLAGCGKYFFPTKTEDNPSAPENAPQQTLPADPEPDPQPETDDPEPEVAPEYGPLPNSIVEKLEKAVRCFTVAPEEFSDPATLSDDAKLYAALLRGSGEFLPVDGDEYTFYLPLDAVPGLLESVFGKGVSLSPGYESGSYYPYEISVSEGVVYRHSEDTGSEFFFTTECSQTGEDEYLIRLANLQDPDFYDVYGQYMADGLKPTKAMVAEFGDDLMTYRYTLRDTGSGYIITSFLYENFEDIWSEIY